MDKDSGVGGTMARKPLKLILKKTNYTPLINVAAATNEKIVSTGMNEKNAAAGHNDGILKGMTVNDILIQYESSIPRHIMSKRTSIRPRGIHGGRVGRSNGSGNGDPFLDDLVYMVAFDALGYSSFPFIGNGNIENCHGSDWNSKARLTALKFELPEDFVSIIFGIILELQHDDLPV
ncbi:hypothetical protein Tco_1284618 [Tanacetum coccineum]